MNLTYDEIVADAARETSLWVRAAAALDNEGAWSLRYFELAAGAPAPSWRSACWEYQDASFWAEEVSGAEVARWLTERQVPIGGRGVEFKPISSAERSRLASRSRLGGYEVLDWPCDSVSFGVTPTTPLPAAHLIADDAEAFHDFGTAAGAFLGVPVMPGRAGDGAQPLFRRQDLTARIASVRIGAAAVSVTLGGREVDGVAVDLCGPLGSQRSIAGGDETPEVEFPIGEPLPAGSWVVIHRGGRWLDRRYLNAPYTSTAEPGVEVIQDSQTRLETLVVVGEGPSTEFKSVLPADQGQIRKALKTVAAFANGQGGTLLFGVENDGRIVGVERASGTEDRLAALVRSWVWPLPGFEVEVLPIGDRVVYAITISSGDRPPYGCGTEPIDLIYYVRRGATTFPVGAEEVRALARSRPQADQQYRRSFG